MRRIGEEQEAAGEVPHLCLSIGSISGSAVTRSHGRVINVQLAC